MNGEGFPNTGRQEIEGQVTFEELEEGENDPRNQAIEKIQSAMERSDLNDMVEELNAQFKDDKELEAIFNKRRETIKKRDKLYYDIGFDSYEEMKKKVKNAINDPDFTKEDRMMIAHRAKHRIEYEKEARERGETRQSNDEGSDDMEPAGESPSAKEEKGGISAVDAQLIRDMHKAGDEGYSDSYITGGDDGFNMPKASFESTDVTDDLANADEEKTASDTDVQNVSEATNDYEQKLKEYHEEMERLHGELQNILGQIDELKKKYESFGIDTSSEDDKNDDENTTTKNNVEDIDDKQNNITDDTVNAVMNDDKNDDENTTTKDKAKDIDDKQNNITDDTVNAVMNDDKNDDENTTTKDKAKDIDDKQKKITDDIINAVMSDDDGAIEGTVVPEGGDVSGVVVEDGNKDDNVDSSTIMVNLDKLLEKQSIDEIIEKLDDDTISNNIDELLKRGAKIDVSKYGSSDKVDVYSGEILEEGRGMTRGALDVLTDFFNRAKDKNDADLSRGARRTEIMEMLEKGRTKDDDIPLIFLQEANPENSVRYRDFKDFQKDISGWKKYFEGSTEKKKNGGDGKTLIKAIQRLSREDLEGVPFYNVEEGIRTFIYEKHGGKVEFLDGMPKYVGGSSGFSEENSVKGFSKILKEKYRELGLKEEDGSFGS